MDGDNIYSKRIDIEDGLVIMGNEANGISSEIEQYVSQKISIPRFGNFQEAESLNVATATAITLGLSVEETAQLANAASECILIADRTDRFVLRLDDMVNRIGEIAWSLQVSKR